MRTGPGYVVDHIDFSPDQMDIYYHSPKDNPQLGKRPDSIIFAHHLYVESRCMVDIINEIQEDACAAIEAALDYEANPPPQPELETEEDD